MINTYKDIMILRRKHPDMFAGLLDPDWFYSWAAETMHVIKVFQRYAFELKTKGHRDHYSAYTIRERIRWDSMTRETGTEYKISNDVTPYIARLLMLANPLLRGMFKTKRGGAW